jgi:non-heme chloroperoxidase
VGHSIAGEELSSVGARHPDRIAGLIYLDAGYAYAYYDRSLGDLNIDSQELQRKLGKLQPDNPAPDQKQLTRELLQLDLPRFQKDLQQLQQKLEVPQPKWPSPTPADLESFPSGIKWLHGVYGWAMPESELRQEVESTPEGHVGKNRVHPGVRQAITSGEQKYTDIRVPVLAIFAVPHDLSPFPESDPVARVYEASEMASTEAQAKAFETGVPSAHVVRLPHANHSIFISNEGDVLREMRTFLAGLH